MSGPRPTDIRLHQKSRSLEITFDDGETFDLSCEFLRVNSPSAEVQGHGPGQEKLQIGKKRVNIKEITPMGNYAIALTFDDKHDSGIYSWETLYALGKNKDAIWQEYLEKLETAGASR